MIAKGKVIIKLPFSKLTLLLYITRLAFNELLIFVLQIADIMIDNP